MVLNQATSIYSTPGTVSVTALLSTLCPWSGRAASGEAASGRAWSGEAASGRAVSGEAWSGRAWSGRAWSGDGSLESGWTLSGWGAESTPLSAVLAEQPEVLKDAAPRVIFTGAHQYPVGQESTGIEEQGTKHLPLSRQRPVLQSVWAAQALPMLPLPLSLAPTQQLCRVLV